MGAAATEAPRLEPQEAPLYEVSKPRWQNRGQRAPRRTLACPPWRSPSTSCRLCMGVFGEAVAESPELPLPVGTALGHRPTRKARHC